MLAIETNDILFAILNSNAELKEEISGGIYAEERPDNSDKEDIVVNNLSLSHDRPQRAINNVNIHIPDIRVKVNGTDQYKMDRPRFRKITDLVVKAIKEGYASHEGALFSITAENILKESGNSHYNNIRITSIIAD